MAAIDTSTQAINIPDFSVFANVQNKFVQAHATQTEFAQLQETLGSVGTRANIFADINTDNEVNPRPTVQQ